MSKFYFIFLCIILTLNSCITPNQSNNPDQIFNGKIYEDGSFDKAIPGPSKTEEISKIGDFYEFNLNKPINLTIKNFDTNTTELIFIRNEENKKGRIELIEKREIKKVKLINKCDIINIGPGEIPVIEVASNLPKHQVVITPRYDKSCYFIGYEIRFGSIEDGCKAGRKVLNDLKRCNGRGGEDPPPPPWNIILFGDS